MYDLNLPSTFNLNPASPYGAGFGSYNALDGSQSLSGGAGGLIPGLGGGASSNATAPPEGGFMAGLKGFGSFLTGSTDEETGEKTAGAGGILKGVSGLANSYLALKQYGLSKKMVSQQEKEFNINFGTRKRLTNANLRDRQFARVSADPSAQSVESYMKQNGVV